MYNILFQQSHFSEHFPSSSLTELKNNVETEIN